MSNKRILSISAKCSDMFNADFEGKDVNGYVPNWFPNPNVNHYGDYIELQIDIDTGQIINWKTPTKTNLDKTFKTNEDEN